MLPYWIQSADFQSKDGEPVDLAGAVACFQSHDWETELLNQRHLSEAGSDSCPPGIGFVSGDGRLLHICPLPGAVVLLHYHYPQQRRLVGLIPVASQATASNDHLPTSRVPEAIGLFFGNQHRQLVSLCADA